MAPVQLRIKQHGDERIEAIHDNETEVVIGRKKVGKKKEGEVVVREKKKTANQYCKIERQTDGSFWLVSLDKKFNCTMNGAPVERAKLRPGDVFLLGDAEIQFGDKPMRRQASLDMLLRLLPLVAIVGVAVIVYFAANAPATSEITNQPLPSTGDNPDDGGHSGTGGADEKDGGVTRITPPNRDEIIRELGELRREWAALKNPVDPDARFDYMNQKLDEMKKFFEWGMAISLHQLVQQQLQAKRREPVFQALYGALIARIPPPKGTPESRREALDEFLRPAIEADPKFVHGLYLYSVVRLIDHVESVGATGTPDRAVIEEVADRLKVATELKPDFSDAHRAAAQAYQYLSMERSLFHIHKALELNPADEENWQAYLTILYKQGLSELKAQAEPTMERLGASNKIKFIVYGLLAQFVGERGEITNAWNYMQKAQAAAEAEEGMLEPEQWIQLYLMEARLAALKSPQDFRRAFAYLDECVRTAKELKKPLVEIVLRYAEVVKIMMASPTNIDRQAKLRQAVDLAFETMSIEALTDTERGTLVRLISEFLDQVDLAQVERHQLWRMTVWVYERGEQLLPLGLKLLKALCPLVNRDGRDFLDPANLEGISDAGLQTIVQVLVNAGLSSTEPRISLDAAPYLGHLLAATGGKFEGLFVPAAREIFRQPLTPDQNSRKVNVLRVMRVYPVPSLAPMVVEELNEVVASGDVGECAKLFREGHPALNAIAEPDFKPEWLPVRNRTTIEEYKQIAEGWKERF